MFRRSEQDTSPAKDPHEPKPFRNVLRKFTPRYFLEQGGIVRRLGPGAGRTYAGLRLRSWLGMQAENQRTAPAASRSFVFVCFGNIMRSAMAEFLMRKALDETPPGDIGKIRVLSAGLHANPGREAHPWAQEAAAELGISLAAHRAKRLTREMVEAADAVLAMDFQNKAELLTLYPESAGKIYMLSAYAEGPWKFREIPDPYLGDLDRTVHCAHQLEICIHHLLAETVFSSCAESSVASHQEPLARS